MHDGYLSNMIIITQKSSSTPEQNPALFENLNQISFNYLISKISFMKT